MNKDHTYIIADNRPTESWDVSKTYDSLYDSVRAYSQSEIYPFHMPGHKRNMDKFGHALPLDLDMTESDGMDDLHQPQGPIKNQEERIAQAYGAAHTFFLVNGSTCGILAGIRSATKANDEILMARNAHQSAYHAIELCQLKAHYIRPEFDESFSMHASVSPEKIEKALDENPQIKFVYLTSPSFEGVLSDIEQIANICHAHQAILMVDQAHGAHFPYTKGRFPSALDLGADLVVESLHKTLPAMTSCSLLHISDRVDFHQVKHNLRIFQTSSPSFILMISIDECLSYLQARGENDHEDLYKTLDHFLEKGQDLKHLRILDLRKETKQDHPLIYKHDPSKIIISTKSTYRDGKSFSGMDLKKCLYEKYKIECEMAYGDFVLALTSIGDKEEGFERLHEALVNIDAELRTEKELGDLSLPEIPESLLPISQAFAHDKVFVESNQAIGHISADFVWAYPPGIPLLVPGEKISEDMVKSLSRLRAQGVSIHTSTAAHTNKLSIIKESVEQE